MTMANHSNFSKGKQIKQNGGLKNSDSEFGYNPTKKKELQNPEQWMQLMQFYRSHLDLYLEKLGFVLFDFQKPIARAIGNFDDSVVIESRSMGKSWLLAACLVGLASLYPEMKIGVASKTLAQAGLILKYVQDFCTQFPDVNREIQHPITMNKTEAKINFKSGAYIETFGIFGSADSARGRRYGIVVLDEARLINSKTIGEIIKPMTQWNRPHWFRMRKLGYKDFVDVNTKVIQISSAYLKSCALYDKFEDNLLQMGKGSKKHFALALDYRAGLRNGYVKKDFVENERRTLPLSIFAYEWQSIFLQSDSSAYYNFEEIEKCRTLPKIELQQPRGSKSRYILTVDPSDTTEAHGDNSCLCVIKLKERADGTFWKEIVYLRTYKGISLSEICDKIREVWLKWQSIEMIIIDTNGLGRSAPDFLDSSFTVDDREYPPFVDPDDERKINIPNSLKILKRHVATNAMNNEMTDYLKVCFQNGDIKFPKSLADYREDRQISDDDEDSKKRKDKSVLLEEEAVIMDCEAAIYEILNIRKKESSSGNFIIEKIQSGFRKDRFTCIAQGLLYIKYLEDENKSKLYKPKNQCWGIAMKF
jgi:hypothetical protein